MSTNRFVCQPRLAYIDSLSGLIPCSVLYIEHIANGQVTLDDRASTSYSVTVKITADRPGYRKGSLVKCLALDVVPRTHVRCRRKGAVVVSYTIRDLIGK